MKDFKKNTKKICDERKEDAERKTKMNRELIAQLEYLEDMIRNESYKSADSCWGGCGLIITNKKERIINRGFEYNPNEKIYFDSRDCDTIIIAENALEISWLVHQMFEVVKNSALLFPKLIDSIKDYFYSDEQNESVKDMLYRIFIRTSLFMIVELNCLDSI